MATIGEVLQAINAYPIPPVTLEGVAAGYGLSLDDTADDASMNTTAFKRTKADLLVWLSISPNVSQGGQTYSFSDEQRRRMRMEAEALLDEVSVDTRGVKYGYKGDSL